MNVLRTIVLTILLLPARGTAAFESDHPGARAAALGGSALTLRGDVVAGSMNPAGLSGLRGVSITAWSVPSLFGIDGLRRMGVAAGLVLGTVPVGIAVSSLGLRGYKETSLSLAVAWPGGDRWSAGARLRLEMLGIEGYGQTSVPALDAGLTCEIADGSTLAIVLTNITATRLGMAGEPLPVSLAGGCAFSPGDAGAILYARCCQELGSPLEWDLGAEYILVPELLLRMGISSEPALLCCGFAVRLDPVTVDYALTHHRQLGGTHHVSVSISFD